MGAKGQAARRNRAVERSERLDMLLSADELARIRHAAKQAGMPVATWCRSALLLRAESEMDARVAASAIVHTPWCEIFGHDGRCNCLPAGQP